MEKRGREMTADEAQQILETTQTRTTLVSWFQPFTEQMISAIELDKKRTHLNGRAFSIRRVGTDYVFRVVGDFVPMTRVSLESLKSRLVVDEFVA